VRPVLPIHLVSVLLIPASLAAQNADAASAKTKRLIPEAVWNRIVDEGKHKSRAMAHLDYLVNCIGPRLTGSDALTTACEWARDYLKQMGYDNARLEQWGTFPVGFNRGPWFGEITKPAELKGSLEFNTSAWSAGTKGRQTGPAILAPRRLEGLEGLEKLGDEIAGKWLVISRQTSLFGRTIPNPRVTEFCRERGALGIVSPSASDLLKTGGNFRISWNHLPQLPQITLTRAEYRKIYKALKKGTEVELSFDIRNHFKKGPIKLYNVIADLVGEIEDEYVIVGGHIDSWDGATGATDNGTGTATTLEAARLLKAAGGKPKRTIRFMLWTGEEQGLLGSRAYVNKHRASGLMNRISAVFVHDMGTNYLSGVRVFANQRPFVEQAFAGVGEIDRKFPFHVHTTRSVTPGSDNYSFHLAGVPAFFWSQSGRAVYQRTWHTQNDTYDAVIPEYQAQSSTVVALGTLGVANLDELLPRSPRGNGSRR